MEVDTWLHAFLTLSSSRNPCKRAGVCSVCVVLRIVMWWELNKPVSVSLCHSYCSFSLTAFTTCYIFENKMFRMFGARNILRWKTKDPRVRFCKDKLQTWVLRCPIVWSERKRKGSSAAGLWSSCRLMWHCFFFFTTNACASAHRMCLFLWRHQRHFFQLLFWFICGFSSVWISVESAFVWQGSQPITPFSLAVITELTNSWKALY